ncbi:MAG: hypothetical protein H0W72_01980 [Planctomycetes bacterium]|nr:hypothetical protein [Planctomycetota bacterium]
MDSKDEIVVTNAIGRIKKFALSNWAGDWLREPAVADPLVTFVSGIACDLVLGRSSDAFFLGIWALLRDGGWPCGYQGAIPNGTYAVYYKDAP